MFAYSIRRVLAVIPLMLAVVTITFFLMHAVKGGPFDDSEKLTDASRARLEERYDLSGSLPSQYGNYLWNLLQGDLGISINSNDRDVTEVIGERFPVSLHIGIYGFVFAIVVGITLGVVSSLNQNGVWDYVGVIIATAGAALPSFVLAPLLVWLLALQFGWFNVLSSNVGPISLVDWSWVKSDFQNWRQIILPVVSLSFLQMAFIARITRAAMLEVMRQDFIRTARAKGLGTFVVVIRHALRNALIPVLTIAGPIFATLITGSLVIERAFAIPGIGQLFVSSVLNRDYGVIMGTTIFLAMLFAGINLLVDIAYAFADPRIRL